MSIEPTCDFCNASDKFRCKNQKQAELCESYKGIKEYKMAKELNKTNIKNLTDLSGRTARSVIAVIDALSQRGGFKGEELLTIGQLREHCAQIIGLSESVSNDLDEETK